MKGQINGSGLLVFDHSLMNDIISLLNFIFTDLHSYQITPGLGADKQIHLILLSKTGIHISPTHL